MVSAKGTLACCPVLTIDYGRREQCSSCIIPSTIAINTEIHTGKDSVVSRCQLHACTSGYPPMDTPKPLRSIATTNTSFVNYYASTGAQGKETRRKTQKENLSDVRGALADNLV
jgi:hypothetical protein